MCYLDSEFINKLVFELIQKLNIREDDAMTLIYDEWEIIEPLIDASSNNYYDIVYKINEIYNIA